MADKPSSIIVIGAGQAGAQAIFSLRQWGYEGQIDLIGDEPDLPYQRPPLSKAYLKGDMARERLYFKPFDYYETQNVTCHIGVGAERIDRTAKTVTLASGETLNYDRLIIATGSRPRNLPVQGADLDNVLDLRGLGDVDRLKPLVEKGGHLVVVGAGYIGLEAAAAARQMGLGVTVMELADRVLQRVTSPEISQFFETKHKAEGVKILTSSGLTGFHGDNGKLTSVELPDGSRIECDIALVGIGILPNVELAEEAGLQCNNGILTNEDAQTSDPDIYACGDCAARPLIHYGGVGRLESVHNAIEQGKLAAAHILGRDRPRLEAPWFWSDQYDIKLQIAGLSTGYESHVIRGNPDSGSFAVFYFKGEKLLAVDAINAAPEFIVTKKLIAEGKSLPKESLSDMNVSMKDLSKSAIDNR